VGEGLNIAEVERLRFTETWVALMVIGAWSLGERGTDAGERG